MLHATSDEITAASQQVYDEIHNNLTHAEQDCMPDDSPIPSYTFDTGFQNTHGYYAYSPGAPPYANYDECAAIASHYNADPQSSQEQPSFTRRPYRYGRKGAKRSDYKNFYESLSPLSDQGGDGFRGDVFGQYQQQHLPPIGARKGGMYAGNYYTGLYHEQFFPRMNSHPFWRVNAMQPVLSPPMEFLEKARQEQMPSDSDGPKAAATFLPSPEPTGTFADTNVKSMNKRGDKGETHPSRVSKARGRRLVKRGTHNVKDRAATELQPAPFPELELNAAEQRALQNVFERQFDMMCRAIIAEFNANHKTQIGADLVLHILQSKDLMSHKTDENV